MNVLMVRRSVRTFFSIEFLKLIVILREVNGDQLCFVGPCHHNSGASPGCGWRIRLLDMESSCVYIE
jgi:hypothetical protein